MHKPLRKRTRDLQTDEYKPKHSETVRRIHYEKDIEKNK